VKKAMVRVIIGSCEKWPAVRAFPYFTEMNLPAGFEVFLGLQTDFLFVGSGFEAKYPPSTLWWFSPRRRDYLN
jgi:hypothetical protein